MRAVVGGSALERTGESHIPRRVTLSQCRSFLEITWSCGTVVRLGGQALRSYCPCARCRARQTLGMQLVTDDPRITALSLMGGSGLQITFADGHDRGIYPWIYLYAIGQGRAQEHLA